MTRHIAILLVIVGLTGCATPPPPPPPPQPQVLVVALPRVRTPPLWPRYPNPYRMPAYGAWRIR